MGDPAPTKRIIHCSKCGEVGHNIRTCWDSRSVPKVSHRRLWQMRKAAAGLCVVCGKEPIHRWNRCHEHWEKQRAWEKTRVRKR